MAEHARSTESYPESPDKGGVGAYKRNAWNSSTAANRYAANVEHYFFDAVTSAIFAEFISPTDRVLDVGAGTGRLSFVAADKGCEVVATDISKSMLQVLEETKGERRIATVLADADALPVEDAQFDAVLSMDFMFHFPNWQTFLREQARVCKRGGHIIYNFYSGDNLKAVDRDKTVAGNYIANGEFIAHCTKDELQEVGDELGLGIVQLQPYGFLAENGLYFPNLTREESAAFFSLFRKTLANEKVLHVIQEFERTIVRDLPLEYCARMMVVLSKTR